MGKVKQYELWRECNCKCTFCTLGNDNCKTPDDIKLKNINDAINDIMSFDKGDVDTVGFIGGEFFQGQLSNQKVKDRFIDLFVLCNALLNNGIIKNIWICASLLIGKQRELYEIIDLIDKKDKIWVLTSWDADGRFHNPKMVDTWINNMKTLSWLYPEVRINTTTILTGSFIDMYLEERFDLPTMKALYNTSFFFKPPVKPDNMLHMTNEEINKIIHNFFPTRNQFLTFLTTFKSREGEDEYAKLYSNNLRADEIIKNYNDENKRGLLFVRDKEHMSEHIDNLPEEENIQLLPCGHPKMFQSYCDSDKCCICDKIFFENI